MKRLIYSLFLSLSLPVFAQDPALMQDAITKPVQSLRCKELLKERTEKIRHQQKLNSLLQRNTDLIKKVPGSKTGLKARLDANQVKVKNELHQTTLVIETMEENIVRSGCPGLSI